VGIDLYLLPVNGDMGDNKMCFAHALLPLDRNCIIGDIQDIAEKHGKKLPGQFSSFLGDQQNGEHGYGVTTKDPYGCPLQYVLGKHLKPLAKKVGVVVQDATRHSATIRKGKSKDGYNSALNTAAFAYISALPDDFKFVLYWH
jgi:hypothetical protein